MAAYLVAYYSFISSSSDLQAFGSFGVAPNRKWYRNIWNVGE
ncbi:hypothetical protein [Metabacillus idriensis]